MNISEVSIFKKAKTKEENISAIEALNVWDALKARYNSLETIVYYDNLIHDRDFSLLLNNISNHYKEQISNLEEIAEKHKIKVPSSPAQELKFSLQLDQVTDKFIFRKIFGDLVYELQSLNRGVITSTVNDNLREIFIEFTMSHLKDYGNLYKYGKAKGWTEIAPTYKTYKPVDKEEISVSEAHHIWDHINLRQDQLHLTKIFLEFVHDEDFNFILKRGKEILEKQINSLVETAKKYEVPVPEKPPKVNKVAIEPEMMEDKFAFRLIFKGIQEAVDGHIGATIETIRNDLLRDLFLNYFREEIKLYDRFLKYGKAKGWTHISPVYKQM